MTFETELTLALLYVSVVLVGIQLTIYMITTRGERMEYIDDFFYGRCALGARLLTGSTQFVLMMCTIIIGY